MKQTPPADDQHVRALAQAAVAAPSLHNAQPWRFRYTRSTATFHLYGDFTRALPHTDPQARALHIGCGAALLNLRAAACQAGHSTLTRLRPSGDEPERMATVRLTSPSLGADEDLAVLHPAVARRHTSRYPFAPKPLPDHIRSELIEAAAREGAILTFPSDWHLRWVLELAQEGASRNREDPGRAEELARWTRVGAAASDIATDGVPQYAFGPRRRGGRAPVRDFAGNHPSSDLGATSFENHPQVALISTYYDGPTDWLRAGQAMERVLLTATLHDVATSFATEALEWTDTRWPLKDPMTGVGHVQMLMRLGYGPRGTGAPRRPVTDVLVIEP
ncbi:nitroreductase [Streptomyces sp. RKND-216]|uniref:Acg family FMN-binding oxidoreductase n=1 Tax=Streptomyces sp. RKND-216 TaxID=2562581 RepID=UPI001FFBD830|nr:nitroreductase [Streptomyces sp. RKND-216]